MGKANYDFIKAGLTIAGNDLRSCYDKYGIVAGRHQYDDYWTRDAGQGCLGALELGDYEIVEKQVAFWTSFQKKDGMIPFLVRQHLPVLQFIGLKVRIPLFPKYRSHKTLYLTKVMDSNAYYVIVLCELIRRKKDKKLLIQYQKNIEAALDWYYRQMDSDFLVKEGWIGGGNDGIYKSGKTLMVSTLMYKAFLEWEELCNDFGIISDDKFIGVSKKIKETLQRDFWNGRYFIDWIGRKKYDYFDTYANLLAVMWGLPHREQSKKIVDFAYEKLYDPPFLKVVYPPYSWWRIEILNKIAFMGNYISGRDFVWSDTTGLLMGALLSIGEEERFWKVYKSFCKNIVENKGFYEVYAEKDKKPIRRFNYTSEMPYPRGTGLFLIAAFEKVHKSGGLISKPDQ